MTAHPIADEAFPLWLDLVGIDRAHFDKRAKNFDGFGSMSHWDAAQASVAIHECLNIPDDELTAQLMLARYLDQFASNTSFDLSEMLAQPQKVQQTWDKARQLRSLLDRDDLMMQRAGFAGLLQDALVHYGAQDREDVQEALEDDALLAQLRRDAYYGIEQMRMNQFLEGDLGTGPRPGYNTTIRRWWRMDDLLAAATHLPEGVSLNMVQPSLEHEIFFCFVVRRGAKLYLLHDAPDREHPLQAHMTRRPDRALAGRMAKFWFPYDMAGVVIDEERGGASVRPADAKALDLPGRFQASSSLLGYVADLPPAELLWSIMMFDRILDRFWGATPPPALPLSCTAGQLRLDAVPLLEEAKRAGLPALVEALPQQNLPSLSGSEVAGLHTHATAAETLGETASLQDRQWLLDRYAAKVPDTALNLVADGEQLAQLTHDGALDLLTNPDHRALESEAFFGRSKAMAKLHMMDPTHFGTASQLDADRRFVARHNLAKGIHGLAKQEYEARKDEVKAWLVERYAGAQARLLALVPLAHAGQLEVIDWSADQEPEQYEILGPAPLHRNKTNREESSARSHQLGIVAPFRHEGGWGSDILGGMSVLGGWEMGRTCTVTQGPPSYWAAFRPTNSVELAWLLDCEVHDLPDVLQHRSGLGMPHGNSILDRIDPMLWALDDPWVKLDLGVRLPLSKRGLSQLLKTVAPVDLSALHGAGLRMFRGTDPAPATRPPRRRRR
jgi:hypothetical protein